MFQLRDYQRAVLIELWKYWRDGGGNPLVDLATGLGKSFLIAELGRRFCQQDRRVLVLSHIREIIVQDIAAIHAVWLEAPLGINSAALGERDTDAPLLLATVQSVFRNPQARGLRDLVLIDECHLVPHHHEGMLRTSIGELHALNGDMRVAGFSATVYWLDSGRLDQGEGRLFDRVVYRYGIREGIDGGWLSPLVAKATDAEIDVHGVGKRGGEFIIGELEAAADKTDIVEAAANEIVRQGDKRRAWLAFCCGIDHAYHVRDALRRRGVACETVVADTPADERRDIIAAFRSGQLRCLTGCNIFTVGFDVAEIDLIAMLRPTWSPGLFVQMAGRGTRKADGKTNCLLLDYAGNVMRHGPVDTVTGETGNGRNSGGTRAKVCPDCRTLVAPRTKICSECGYAWPERLPIPRLPQHDRQASNVAPLSGALTWLTVLECSVDKHFKPGRPPSLRIDFWTGHSTVSDWLAFDHGDGARWYANKKWRVFGGREPVPLTVAAALSRQHEITSVAAIGVRRDGDYWRVVEVKKEPQLRCAAS
jgi:DNA repair protein RadD